MEQTDFDGIVFADTLQDFNNLRYAGHIVHILCCGGNMDLPFKTHATILQWAIMSFCLMENSVLSFQYPTIFKVF